MGLSCVLLGLSVAPFAVPTDLFLPVPSVLQHQPGEFVLGAHFGVALQGPRDVRVTHALERALQRVAIEHDSYGIRVSRYATAQLTLIWSHRGAAVQQLQEDESYTLIITPAGATLTADNPLGILHGLETFTQSLTGHHQDTRAPCLDIHDTPRFLWRGLMLDAARHFLTVDAIKRNLDGMAAVKLNVLHWHLTDDQGFRIESKRLPELHRAGAQGQYYTQEQVRDIIAYARDRGIRVVPEFDMPGHTQSWLVAHPELASKPDRYTVGETWGIYDATLDPSREHTYALIEQLLAEMARLFPDNYVHIGGDEVTGKDWQANTNIRRFMMQHGLGDVAALHAYFVARISTLAERRGKRIMGWDEILQPGLHRDAVIQSWRGETQLQRALAAGYEVVVSHGFYLDHGSSAAQYYLIDPTAGLDANGRRHVLGAEACQWTELVTNDTLDAYIWPRAAAIAERLWSAAELQDTDDMYRRLQVRSAELALLGLTHRTLQQRRLASLVDSVYLPPLEELAAVLEPARRSDSPGYNVRTPLDGFADALPPESQTAHELSRGIDSYLNGAPLFLRSEPLRQSFARLANNHMHVLPAVQSAASLRDVGVLSEHVHALSELALQALHYLDTNQRPPRSWLRRAVQTLRRAREPSADARVAIVAPVRKLVAAAAAQAHLRALSVAQWLQLVGSDDALSQVVDMP